MSTRPLAHQVVPGTDGAESATAENGAVRPRDSLFHWSGTVDALRQTTHGADRQAMLQAYFGALAAESIAPAARFFSGVIAGPNGEALPPVADDVVMDAMGDLARIDRDELRERCRAAEDLGCVAAEIFAGRLPSGISISDVAAWGREMANAQGATAQRDLVRDMLARLSSLEARYFVNLITGRLDTGLDAREVEEARAHTRPR